MNRATEHAGFAAGIIKTAVLLLDQRDAPLEDIAAAYKHLLQARTELDAAIANIQARHPEAVFEAHRTTPRPQPDPARECSDVTPTAYSLPPPAPQ